MKSLILFFALLTSTNCFSQIQITELNKYLSSLKVVTDLENLKSKKFITLNLLHIQNELDRKVDFGYIHTRKMIMTQSNGDLRIDILSKGDTIKIGLTTILSLEDNEPIYYKLFKGTDSIIHNYIEKHNSMYATKLKKNQFIKQLNNEYTVGYGCGIVGMNIPKHSYLAKLYVKQKNKHKLSEWLRSFSPELQTLGTIGLNKIGLLSKEEKKIIKHLLSRNTLINSCSGCLYGLQKEYKDLINLNIDN